MTAHRNWGPGHPSYPRASMITPDPRPECAQRWCREPASGGAAYCRHHATGGAPTLPTRAERDLARPWLQEQARHPMNRSARVALRLLDWADAQEAGEDATVLDKSTGGG